MEKVGKETKLAVTKKVVHFRPLFFMFLSLLIGIIFARRIYSGDLRYIIVTIVIFAIVLGLCFRYKKIIPFLLCLLVFAMGNGMYFLSMTPYLNAKQYDYVVAVVGRVTDAIEDHGIVKTYVIENVTIDGEIAKNMRLNVRNDAGEIQVGDIISFECVPSRIQLFNLGNFNNEYVRNGVLYESTTYSDYIVRTSGNLKFDETIRKAIKDSLLGSMSEENAYVAYAVLTGEKSGIESEIYEDYRATGILHLLTVSSLHVGVLTSFLAFILKKCKANKWVSFVVTAVLLLFYNYICGFAPSVMRATIMGLTMLLSYCVRKQYDSLTSISIAGILICLINPLYAFDAGFLMSFFCVLFISLLYNPFSRALNKIFPKWASSYITLSVCAQIGVLPFLASFYSSFNFLTFFVNLIVVPIFSVVFILLLVFSFLTTLLHFMGFLLVIVNYAFSALNWIAHFYNEPVLSVNLSPLNVEISATIFLLAFVISQFVMLRWKPKLYFCSILACFLVIFSALSYVPSKNKDSEVYYYYGESILLRARSGQTLLVGNSNSSAIKPLLNYIDVYDVNYLYSESEMKADELAFYKSRNLNAIISPEGQITMEAVENKTIEYELTVGDFDLRLFTYGDTHVGLKINFDEMSILFVLVEETTYDMYNFVKRYALESDCCFSEGFTHFLSNEFAKINFTSYYSGEVDYSYYGDGNIKVTKGNGILNVRCID